MRTLVKLFSVFIAALLVACGGGSAPDKSAVRVMAAARAPQKTSCDYEHIYVTVERVRIYQAGGEQRPQELILPTPRRIDLIGLSAGVLEALGVQPLSAGNFAQVRLVLVQNSAADGGATANAVQEGGKGLVPLSTPGAQQSGLKLRANLEVAQDEVADVFLAANPCQSITNLGNGGYVLGPVLAAEARTTAVAGRGEFRVNTTTAGHQRWPVTAALSSGGYVVAWTDESGIFLQRFDLAGAATGGQTRIDIGSEVNAQEPAITGLPGGGYVVTWKSFRPESTSHGSTVHVQAFGPDGATVGAQALVSVGGTVADESQQSVVPLGQSGYLVAWTPYYAIDSVFPAILGQRFDADGAKVGAPTQLVAPALGAWVVASAGLTSGGYVLAWIDGRAGVYTQSFGPAGDMTGGAKFVSFSSDGSVMTDGVAIAGLADGGYVVTWDAYRGSTGWDIVAQQFDAAGTPKSPVDVNTVMAADQIQPRVASLAGGGYAVVWASQDASGWGIYLQRFDGDGARVGGNTLVNTTTELHQMVPDIAGLRDGGYLVTWMSTEQDGGVGADIYAQRYRSDGSAR